MRRPIGGLVMLLALGACSGPSPDDQMRHGQEVYQTYCAACHEAGQQIGPHLTQRVLATRLTADALYRYTRRFMPYEAGNTLSPEDYQAVTAFLLRDRGLMPDNVVLTEENAPSLSLKQGRSP